MAGGEQAGFYEAGASLAAMFRGEESQRAEVGGILFAEWAAQAAGAVKGGG